jgi:hypothetical protein
MFGEPIMIHDPGLTNKATGAETTRLALAHQ